MGAHDQCEAQQPVERRDREGKGQTSLAARGLQHIETIPKIIEVPSFCNQ